MSAIPRKHVQFKLMFHNSRIHDLDVLMETALSLPDYGVLPADKATPKSPIEPVDDVASLVHKHLIDYSQDPTGYKVMRALWSVHFWLVIPDKRDLIASLAFDFIDGQRNRMDIGGLADFEFKDQRHYVEPFAQQLKDLGLALYPLVQPMLGWVDESFSNETDTKDSLKLKLRTISWVNFFGQAYVREYGQDFLLGLPRYKIEILPDGGVFHQLSPTFLAASEREAKALRQRIIAYCAQHGLKVTCRAPYYIPGVSPVVALEPVAPVSDTEVQAYLQRALATTLVLTDGTRVKPIHISWDDLTPKQRQMALEAIKQVAIAEIKQPSRKRIRLEFNEIPDNLDQMLADLVGRGNPDFEWVQAEIGEEP